MRAISISVAHGSLPVKAVPGSFVDVLFRTTEDEERNVPELTAMLVRKVRILTIDNNSTPGTTTVNDKKIDEHLVTLAVSQSQSLRIRTAEGHGEFSLSLLSSSSDEYLAEVPDQLKLAEVFQLPERKSDPVPFVAEVYRRGQRRTIKFDDEPATVASQKSNRPRSVPSIQTNRDDLPPDVESVESREPQADALPESAGSNATSHKPSQPVQTQERSNPNSLTQPLWRDEEAALAPTGTTVVSTDAGASP